MLKEQNIKRILLIMGTSTLLALFVYAGFFLHIGVKNRAISLVVNEVDLIIQKEIRLRSIQNFIRDTQADRIQLNKYFVGKDAVVDFIETIEDLSALSGTTMEITSVSVDAIESGSLAGELLRLNFKVFGVWRDVFYLLTLIESLPLEVTITQANFKQVSTQKEDTKEPEQPWSGTFGLTVVKLK